jgi:hypothetical protein
MQSKAKDPPIHSGVGGLGYEPGEMQTTQRHVLNNTVELMNSFYNQ